MPKSDEKRPQKTRSSAEEVARSIDRGRTIRTFIVCGTILWGLEIVADAVVEIATKPLWAAIVTVILGCFVAPTPVILKLKRSREKFVRKNHGRTAELEKELDKRRTSSQPEVEHKESEDGESIESADDDSKS